jgi:hypothetical protein
MSASTGDLQEHVDAILIELGRRLKCGSLVIHMDDYRVQKVEVLEVFRPHQVRRVLSLDKPPLSGAG